MDLSLSDSQEAFRRDVRAFVESRLPPALRRKMRIGHTPNREEIIAWQRTLHERGWAAPHWPKEHGGADLGPIEKILLQEELFCAPAPQPLSFNVTMLGPVLLEFGSPEQIAYWLPKLARLDVWFCQGFSEPGAGSDLASLSTSAQRSGDNYIVNGQKIWTTQAHYADWMFCLVRTSKENRKQDGISMLLIDLKSPGVEIRPIHSIDGAHHLNEVFFKEVRVPLANLVGAEGKGWDCTKFLLKNERTMIGRVGFNRERLSRAEELLAGAKLPPFRKQRIEETLIVLRAEVRALEMLQWRLVHLDPSSSRAALLASILKLKGSELLQRTTTLLLQLSGSQGLELMTSGNDTDRHERPHAASGPQYLYSRATTIFGGTSEIQKELIAREVLR